MEKKINGGSNYPFPYFSYSQINSYMTCPYGFYLNYIKGHKIKNKYTELGSLLHAIYERISRFVSIKGELPEEMRVLSAFTKAFSKIKKDLFEDKADQKEMYEKGVQSLVNVLNSDFIGKKPVALEQKFKVKLADDMIPFYGFIDRIDGETNDPSTWIVIDYKTGNTPKTKQYLKDDLQLPLYASAVYALYGAYPMAVGFYHPVPNKVQVALHKGNGIYEFQGQRNPSVTFDCREAVEKTKEIIQEISNQNFDRNTSNTFFCQKFCSFYEQCNPFGEKASCGIKQIKWGDVMNG